MYPCWTTGKQEGLLEIDNYDRQEQELRSEASNQV